MLDQIKKHLPRIFNLCFEITLEHKPIVNCILHGANKQLMVNIRYEHPNTFEEDPEVYQINLDSPDAISKLNTLEMQLESILQDCIDDSHNLRIKRLRLERNKLMKKIGHIDKRLDVLTDVKLEEETNGTTEEN